jgi:hypothetical protein
MLFLFIPEVTNAAKQRKVIIEIKKNLINRWEFDEKLILCVGATGGGPDGKPRVLI